MYGAVGFILSIFCTSATVVAENFNNLYLGSFPQKDLKMPTPSGKKFRVPDFAVLVVQSGFDKQPATGKIKDTGVLLWEVKASLSKEPFPLCREKRVKFPNIFEDFVQHFPQITTQVIYARAKFHQKQIYVLLSIDMWFLLLHFLDDHLPLSSNPRGDQATDFTKFTRHIIVPPAPIVNENCTAFTPEFLYAMELSVQDLHAVTVTPHRSFWAPEGTAIRVSSELIKHQLSEKLDALARDLEADNRVAWGEESDERSSVSEDTGSKFKERKYRYAGVPAKASPAQTRSKTRAAAAKASTRAGASNVANRANSLQAETSPDSSDSSDSEENDRELE